MANTTVDILRLKFEHLTKSDIDEAHEYFKKEAKSFKGHRASIADKEIYFTAAKRVLFGKRDSMSAIARPMNISSRAINSGVRWALGYTCTLKRTHPSKR